MVFKISDVTINDFNLDYRSNIRFKLGVDENATHKGVLHCLESHLEIMVRILM